MRARVPRSAALPALLAIVVSLGPAPAPAQAHPDATAGTAARLSTPSPPPAASDAALRSVAEVLAAVREATARYLDIVKAREDGFVQASGMEPDHGYHFVRPDAYVRTAATALATGEVDLARPPILIYLERDGVWQLAGVEYALPSRPTRNPLPGADWHEHEASCHYRDFRETPAARPGDCPARHPDTGAEYVLWHPPLAIAHVWAWYPNPDGPFAAANRYLAPYGGPVAAPPGHRHARNPAELLYSQWTHRMAGAILLVLAAVTAWQLANPRPFPWNALSAPLWIVFGCYLFVTSDPESWPLGPKRFIEIFGDALVLQHKLLALIPVIIGLVEGLAAADRLRFGAAHALVPALAIVGGVSLFVHFHDGTFHLDAIYLQHAAMGATAGALGITLLVARFARQPRRFRWTWPAFLIALGIVLLAYTEA